MQESLKEALADKRGMDKAQKRLKYLNEEIYRFNRSLERLAKIVDKEYQDIETLEGSKLKGLFRLNRKEHEQQMEKEKQEYLDAVLRYNQAVKEIEMLEFERSVLLDKLLKRPEIEARYQEELKKYEAELSQSDTRLGQELRKIDHKIMEIYLKKEEVLEALDQGRACLKPLWLIEQHLSKDASPVDTPDRLLTPPGWNPLEYFSQVGRLEKARRKLPEVSQQLKLFIEELGDVYSRPEVFLGINFKEFQRLSDYFFDSYIADWRFKDRINQLYEEISRIIRVIESTLNVLQNEVKKEEEQASQLEKQKETLIKHKLN